jgi:hypothetical protein
MSQTRRSLTSRYSLLNTHRVPVNLGISTLSQNLLPTHNTLTYITFRSYSPYTTDIMATCPVIGTANSVLPPNHPEVDLNVDGQTVR